MRFNQDERLPLAMLPSSFGKKGEQLHVHLLEEGNSLLDVKAVLINLQ